MWRQNKLRFQLMIVGIACLSLILTLTSSTLATSIYLAADHHTRQFDAWNADSQGIASYQGTYSLQYSTDPAGIALYEQYNADGSQLWSTIFITSEGSAGVEIVDPRSLQYLGVSTGPSNLAGIHVHDDTLAVYSVRRSSNDLYIFQYDHDTQSISQTSMIDLPGCQGAFGIALDEGRNTLWVADTAAGIARAYDILTWTEDPTRSFTPTHKPVDIAVDRRRNLVYTVSIIGGASVPSGTGSTLLCKHDVATGENLCNDMGFPGVGVAVDETWGIVYVTGGANYGDNLSSWDTTTTPFTKLYDSGVIGNPAGIAIGRTIYDPGNINLLKNNNLQGAGIGIGETFTYTISFNSPSIDLTNVVITDQLPPELDYISSARDGVPDSPTVYDPVTHTITWVLGNISAGQPVPVISLVVRVNLNAVIGEPINNYCEFNSNELPPVSNPPDPDPPIINPPILCPDDGIFCNGQEVLLNEECAHSGNPCPDDGQFCNGIESCDEANKQCVTTGVPCPDNGQFCDGTESCDEATDQCASSGDPCTPPEVCNEDTDECINEIPVSVDIKPGSCPNPMRMKCNGVLPAAILGSDKFDVATIDPATIMITRAGMPGGVPLLRYNYEDVATPFEGTLCDCHTLGKDGYMDLTLKFMVSAVVEGLKLYELADRETIPLTIVGETYDGIPMKGEDCVWIIGYLTRECKSDHDCDTDVDGTDANDFKKEFGRRNCSAESICIGDYDGDGDVDGVNAFLFKSEFGTRLLQ